jgi:hypothetical protein
LLSGMLIGGLSATVWIVSGGAFLPALMVYSVVATSVILGVAVLTFWVSERGSPRDGLASPPDTTGGDLHPAFDPAMAALARADQLPAPRRRAGEDLHAASACVLRTERETTASSNP